MSGDDIISASLGTTTNRFSVEFIGSNKLSFGGRMRPGPYALFQQSRKGWKHVMSGESVYLLVQQAKVFLRESRRSEERVLLSQVCRLLLEIEIQHYEMLRRAAGNST